MQKSISPLSPQSVIAAIKRAPWCCFNGCQEGAEWELCHGDRDVDYTHACTDHVGHLLTDAPITHIYRIPA